MGTKFSTSTLRVGRGVLGWPNFTLVPSDFNKFSTQVMGFSYLIRYTIHIFSAGGCYQLQVREYSGSAAFELLSTFSPCWALQLSRLYASPYGADGRQHHPLHQQRRKTANPSKWDSRKSEKYRNW